MTLFQKLASIIAIVSIICCILSLFTSAMAHSWFQIPVVAVCSLIYIGVLLADKWEKPVLYLPFLILVVSAIMVVKVHF